MSGILGSSLNGSNSNLPDATGRAFAASYTPQSGSSGSVLNQSGGNLQGIHNIHGSFNMSNIPGQYASRNPANLNAYQNNVQQAQAPGTVSNGRYTMNNLSNTLSQLSLGSPHAHSGVSNNGGPGMLSNIGSTGRVANSIGGIVGSTPRGSGSSGIGNIPGVASRMTLTGPQVASLLGNSFSGSGVQLSQNQYQAGNNNFSYMALLNDANGIDNLDINDFPQLSGHPHSAGGSQGQLGLLQKHNLSFNQQNQEFSIQNEDFPALPGYKGGLNGGSSGEYTLNAHQKEQLHDSMTNLLQSQQSSIGRPSGYSFGGGSYSSHHPQQQQHRSLSLNGNGVSYLSSGHQDLHYHGPEQYQQFHPSQSRFIDPFREEMMGPQILTDKYGMLGLLGIVKRVNPALTSLALGIDLTTLGLNLNSTETLYKKFASPWSDEPVRGEPEFTVPECYYSKQPPPLRLAHFAKFRPELLLFIFYSMPKDEAQLLAANELYNRGWFYHKEHRLWFTRMKSVDPLVKTNAYERGSYFCFDPNTWQSVRKDNFLLQYELVEKRPVVPQLLP